jgi:hypothetical protein
MPGMSSWQATPPLLVFLPTVPAFRRFIFIFYLIFFNLFFIIYFFIYTPAARVPSDSARHVLFLFLIFIFLGFLFVYFY